MLISKDGIELIKRFEGCKLEAYRCPAGVWTIGYGHTKDVKRGDKISQQQADKLLSEDSKEFSRNISYCCEENHILLNQHEFDAVVCFAYNVGFNAFVNSTLFDYLENGDKLKASNEFLRWNKVKGKPVLGLTRRRNAERELFVLGAM